MRRVIAVAIAACGSKAPPPAWSEQPHATAPHVATTRPPPTLMGFGPYDGSYEVMHLNWYDNEAKPASDRDGASCRKPRESMDASEFPARLRTCIAGCDAGDPPSCVIAALWLLNTAGDEAADRARGLEFLERACASNQDPLGCFILGEELDRGERVAKHDPESARAAWRRGCDQHEQSSCAALRGERMTVEEREIYRAPGH